MEVEVKERERVDQTTDQRDVLFISHATPGDNEFATWLASRLSMAGYDVWCDQQKLLGGEDFWQDIEDALRQRTVKFILVVSQKAFDDDGRLRSGIKDELAIARIMKKQMGDNYFIIPMRIDDTKFDDFPIDFVRLNGIDCGPNWASGFHALLKVLERDDVNCASDKADKSVSAWRAVHQHHARAIKTEKEILQSNWLPIRRLPPKLNFFECPGVKWDTEPRVIASECPLPCFDHHRLLGSFASEAELQEALGGTIPIKFRGALKTKNFLRGRTGDIVGLAPRDAKNKVTSLVRQAWDNHMRALGLEAYEMANGRLAWWFPEGIPEDGNLRFVDFSGKSRRRAVSGTKGKKEGPNGTEVPRYYWHLGFTGKPFLTESPFIVLQPRIIISEDGKTPLTNKTRLNSVRRSLTKMWFNDRWRCLTLGIAAWLSGETDWFDLNVGSGANVTIGGNPLTFEAPVGIATDAVSSDLSDELADAMAQAEAHLRLSDPAFLTLEEEEDEE